MTQVRAALVKCGRCGKRYSNPFTHHCISSKKLNAGHTKVKPTLGVELKKCGKCGKTYNNPLTHTCRTKTDFKKRKAQQGRDQNRKTQFRENKPQHGAALPQVKPSHDYKTCRDRDCSKYQCRAYRDGIEEGFDQGHAEGYSEGYSEGYADGHAAGSKW